MTGSCIQHAHSCLALSRLTGRLPFVVLLRLLTDFSQNEQLERDAANKTTVPQIFASAKSLYVGETFPVVMAIPWDSNCSLSSSIPLLPQPHQPYGCGPSGGHSPPLDPVRADSLRMCQRATVNGYEKAKAEFSAELTDARATIEKLNQELSALVRRQGSL